MVSVRTANDFNKEYLYGVWRAELEAANQPRKGQAVRNAVFYAALLGMVLFAFFYSGEENTGKSFGPFAYSRVLTGSMQSVYPKGSLITSWAVKPDEPLKAGLADGTDIVFTKEDGTTVVHRVIEIFDDYEDTGMRAFRTQGVDNPEPDAWITGEINVIGRVTWHVPYVGDALAFVAENIVWVAAILVVLFVIGTMLSFALRKEN
jgi:signal peptidase